MGRVYDHPRYYALAFGFRDVLREVRVMEEAIDRFSRVLVTTVLETGCGHAPHLDELLRRGYRYVGLDRSEPMLAEVRRKAATAGGTAETVRGDMTDFALPRPAEFAFNALGSMYVASRSGMSAHLAAMSAALAPGGLYLLDWVLWTWDGPERQTWAADGDGVAMTVTWSAGARDEEAGTVTERLVLQGDDRGRAFRLEEENLKLALPEDEFSAAVEVQGAFEYLGSWNDWDLGKPLGSVPGVNRPVTLLRKR